MGENLGVRVRSNYTAPRYSSLRDPWNTSTHRWHYSNSIIYETAKGTWYHTMGVEGGHSGKDSNREVMSALERGQRGSGLSILRFPSLKQRHGDPEPAWATALFWVGYGTGQPPRRTNEHFHVSVSIHSISKHPQKLQAQVRESRWAGLCFVMVFP